MPEFQQYLKNGQCQWSRIAFLPIRIGGATYTDTGIFSEVDWKLGADCGCDTLALQSHVAALARVHPRAVCQKWPLSSARHGGGWVLPC